MGKNQSGIKNGARGVTTLLVIVFMGLFILVILTLTSLGSEEARFGRALYAREQALSIAESGLEYYRWFLGHNPNDLTNGTGGAGPYTYTVTDPETGDTLGSAAISVSANTQCGVVQWIDITSKGTSNVDTGFPRTLFARYMQKSVAWYSYLLNSNVFAGSDRVITGPYFSNGGIRMDGSNQSDVLSAVSTWVCGSNYGCSPTQNSAAGVLGSGSGSVLWKYPVASIDFNGLAADLANLKTYAQGSGRYFAPASGSVNNRGYHLVFKNDGTFDAYRVTGTTGVEGSADGANFAVEYNIIASQTFLGNYTIPVSCSLIFVDDRAWIEGTVKGKVTVVAATPSDTTTAPDIILPNNINYASYDGSNGLTAIAERNVLIPLNSPDTLTLHGIFVAQNGYYGRNYYTTSGTNDVPSAYDSFVIQSSLTTVGSIVSSGRTGTKWINGSGTTVSGYQNRVDSYDELQAAAPPPFTPAASADFHFVVWQEQ